MTEKIYEVKKQSFLNVLIVGRPNVGKSLLFNRILGKGRAIVDSEAGLTRDLNEELVRRFRVHFHLSDTAGLSEEHRDELAREVQKRSLSALKEADLFLFVLEKGIVTPEDQRIAELLRPIGRPVFLILNKCDDPKDAFWTNLAFELGLGSAFPLSALRGWNLAHFLEELEKKLEETLGQREKTQKENLEENITVPLSEENLKPKGFQDSDSAVSTIPIAIIGRPNAGKSSLFNQLLKTSKSLVHQSPGTTRDSIRGETHFQAHTLEFWDTAGMRRKARISENIEYYSVNRALKSIERVEIVLHLIDVQEGLSEQDKKILDLPVKKGKAFVIILNKSDLFSPKRISQVKESIRFHFPHLYFIPILSVSAKNGVGVQELLKKILELYRNFHFQASPKQLREILQQVQKESLSSRKGFFKIYSIRQVEHSPPHFLFFVNRIKALDPSRQRYLKNRVRKNLALEGIPVFLSFQKIFYTDQKS